MAVLKRSESGSYYVSKYMYPIQEVRSWRVSREGFRLLREEGIEVGDQIPQDLSFSMVDEGYLYTLNPELLLNKTNSYSNLKEIPDGARCPFTRDHAPLISPRKPDPFTLSLLRKNDQWLLQLNIPPFKELCKRHKQKTCCQIRFNKSPVRLPTNYYLETKRIWITVSPKEYEYHLELHWPDLEGPFHHNDRICVPGIGPKGALFEVVKERGLQFSREEPLLRGVSYYLLTTPERFQSLQTEAIRKRLSFQELGTLHHWQVIGLTLKGESGPSFRQILMGLS